MHELIARLGTADPEAAQAVQAIAYFDGLSDVDADPEAILRGLAALLGSRVRLVDDGHGVAVSVAADGTRREPTDAPHPAWPRAALTPGGAPAIWVERLAPSSAVQAFILERAARVVRVSLERRARGIASGTAPIAVAVDATATVQARRSAAVALGIPLDAHVRAVVLDDERVVLVVEGGEALDEIPPDRRAGVGPLVTVDELPRSLADAIVALRFTGAGTTSDPIPRVVEADALGGLRLLADVVDATTAPIDDVQAIERALGHALWMASTLAAVATHPTLRTAAAALHVHHSTLQRRVERVEAVLGWRVLTVEGRLRLQLAGILHRLHRPRLPT